MTIHLEYYDANLNCIKNFIFSIKMSLNIYLNCNKILSFYVDKSLKATILNSNLKIITSKVVCFDFKLPHYKIKDGVYRDSFINGKVVSPTLIWVEALNLIFQKLSKSKLILGRLQLSLVVNNNMEVSIRKLVVLIYYNHWILKNHY